MNQLLNLFTLQKIRGSRSQVTLILIGFVKVLVSNGVINMTPDQLSAFEQTLYFLLGYFLIEKVDDIKKGAQK